MKNFRLKRFIISFILFCFIFSSLPTNIFAVVIHSKANASIRNTKTYQSENNEETNGEPSVGEIVNERTENTKTYYNGDGKYTEKIYFEPIHTKESGEEKFEEISPDLVNDQSTTNIVTTENTAIDTDFLKTMSHGKYANFSYKGHSLSLSIMQAIGEGKTTLDAKDVNATFVENTNKIVHKGIFPSIDLQNYTFSQNTKEDLVLHQYDGYHIFKFKLITDLKAVIEDGSILLKDEENNKIFELPKPVMSDSNYDEGSGETATSDQVNYEIEKTETGYLLTLNADPEWLASPDRVFPIFIDPTTSVTNSSDTFVMGAYPTTNYSSTTSKWDSGLGEYILKVGYYDSTTGNCYALLNQALPANLNGLTITSATFNAYVTHSASASATDIFLDRNTESWNNSTVTWDTRPSSTNIKTISVAKDQWASFDVTSTVKGWLSGSLTNYGFKIHENGNGKSYWKKIVSTSNSDNNPYISVDYSIPTPETPPGKVYSYGDGSNTGYVDLDWDPIPGATGYNVWIFNGKDYEAFPVGTATWFTTKGKKIWPSSAEITNGDYGLHHVSTDGGTELPLDPSILYKKNGNVYPDSKNYWFRISAIYPRGESATSNPYRPTIPNTLRPATPTGTSYTNGNGTGYADFKWDAVTGATGYKIWMWNGVAYESLDVGNVTSWTTKGKKYWPTSAEISAGKYALHLDDNAGAELPLDPAPAYANAGTAYADTHHYYIRVSAYNDTGESVYSSSYFGPTISSLSVPSPPTGRAYTNLASSNSGYVNLNWNKIPYATGYKVWVYNGKDYESYDVGDVDNWTTQNKGIWPSQAEIDGGMKNLHHPANETETHYGGVELPLEPFKLYAKNGTTYATSPYYYFRISAYDEDGETVYSSTYFRTPMGQPVPFLGTEDYWSFIDIPYGKANIATGNLIIDEEDFSISGRGPELSLNRTYNSLSTSVGLFGPGWHSDAEMKVTASSDKSNVTLVDEDGTSHLFTKLADGTYQAPTGVYLELTEDTISYILKTTDQSKAYFSKTTGLLTEMKDGYGNTLSYTYDSNDKLTKVTDASGRTLTFDFNAEGFISSVTGPESRKVSYTYQNGFLSKVTQTADEVTSYEYVDGKLTKVFEPNHTVEKPVVNKYQYDSETNQLIEVQNPKNQTYILDYDLPNKQLTFTSPKGNKDQYTYNDAANPTKLIEDVGGLNITSTFNYEGNNLVETKDPNDQASSTPTEKYTYDANGNVLTAADSYGTETYQYNSNNDVTSVVDTEGDQTTIAYDDLDAVSETDQTGKTSSIAKYQKDANGNSNGNLLESSYTLSTATNLLSNNSFETDLTGWTKITKDDSGALSVDSITTNDLTGNKSLKITTQSTSETRSYITATQIVNVEGNKSYTLSGLVKTDLYMANAFFNVLFMDSNNASISWIDNRYNQISGNRGWTERQLSFKTPANAAKVRIYLDVEHTDATASGTAWFDRIQLEKAEVSSSYNPIINSSFNGALTNWTGSGGSVDTTNGFEDSDSLKVARTTTTQSASEYKQTVTIGQSSSDNPLDLTLTGLSKADNVVKNGTVTDRDYSIVGNVTYTDGSTKEYVANFPVGTQDWNRAAIKIPATKPITKIDVSTIFKGNYTGTVWYDGLRLMKGSIITKNKYDAANNYVTETEDELGFVSSSTFDQNGNETSETDAQGEKKIYQFDAANQLKNLLLANGTSISYGYDQNGNMTSKTIESYQGTKQTYTYRYDENGAVTETVGPLNDKTTNEYDSNGNNIKTTLPNGNTITNEYDGTDRVKSVSYNGEKTYEYSYDKNGNETSLQYTKESRSKTRTFDSSNRVVKQEDRGATQEWKYSTTSDKLNELIVNHGSLIQHLTYQYNELDQNTVVNDGEHSYRFDYDERGNVKTFTTGNGSGASFKYDDRGLVQQVVIGQKDGLDILDETYQYDANGNRTSIKYPNGQSISYEFGKLDQLEKETLKDGTILEYSYDGFGNRTSVKETKDSSTNTTTSEYNLANQLTKFGTETIKYDLNGNRTEDGEFNYKWDSQDQLESITKKGEGSPFVTYRYDEDGRRIQKSVGSTITNYHYDGDSLNVLYETNDQNQVTRSYIYSESGQLLAMKKGTEKYFYHLNAHGDVIALTDKNGQVVASYEYDAWGNPLKAEESAEVKDNPYRYAGYQFDHETGMYYLIARYYQSIHGVFLSLDSDPGDDDDILTQNGYSYASNNPLKFIDPDGNKRKAVVEGLKFLYKYGKKAAKKSWEKVKKLREKKPKVHKVGRLKGSSDKGKGYFGILYSTKKKNGKRTYSTVEYHTPHNGHGYHLQSNKYSKYNSKWIRGKVKWRKTIWKAKDW